MGSKTLSKSLLFVVLSFSVALAQDVLGGPAPDCEYRRMDSLWITHADVPLYPPLAVQARLSGTITIRIVVKGGAVASAESKTPNLGPLSAAAVENVKTWRFAPQSYGDFCIRYTYALDGTELPAPRNPTVEMDFPGRVKITTSPVQRVAIPSAGGTAK